MEDVSSPILLLRAGKLEHALALVRMEVETPHQTGGAKMLLGFLRECRKLGIAPRDLPRSERTNIVTWYWALQYDFEAVREAFEEFPEVFAENCFPLSCAMRTIGARGVHAHSYILNRFERENTVTPEVWWNHMNSMGSLHVMAHLRGDQLKWYINRVFCDNGQDWRKVRVAADKSRNLWEFAMTNDQVDACWVADVLLKIDSHRLTLDDFALKPALVSENPFLKHYYEIPQAKDMKELEKVFDRLRIVGEYKSCLCWPICYEENKPAPPKMYNPDSWPMFSEVLEARAMVEDYNRKKQHARLVGWRASLRGGWMR